MGYNRMLSNRGINQIFDFYFKKLNVSDRRVFLEKFNDKEIVDRILLLQELFIQHPFYHESITREAASSRELENIISWQKAFYLSIYSDCKRDKYRNSSSRYYYQPYDNSEAIQLYNLLEFKNASFKFLIDIKSVLGEKENEEDKSGLFKNLFSLFSIVNHEKILEHEFGQIEKDQEKEINLESKDRAEAKINRLLSRINEFTK